MIQHIDKNRGDGYWISLRLILASLLKNYDPDIQPEMQNFNACMFTDLVWPSCEYGSTWPQIYYMFFEAGSLAILKQLPQFLKLQDDELLQSLFLLNEGENNAEKLKKYSDFVILKEQEFGHEFHMTSDYGAKASFACEATRDKIRSKIH